jgi:hypothetical protein
MRRGGGVKDFSVVAMETFFASSSDMVVEHPVIRSMRRKSKQTPFMGASMIICLFPSSRETSACIS